MERRARCVSLFITIIPVLIYLVQRDGELDE